MEETFRVATWNLWWRFERPEERQSSIVAELEDLSPDVIGLQEVWFADGGDLASEMGDLLGYQVYAAQMKDPAHWHRLLGGAEDFGVGNAVLSRWPIVESEVLHFGPDGESNECRLALCTLIETPFGPIRFATTHLNSGWTHSEIRASQLSRLLGWLGEMPEQDVPLFLTGDLNAGPDSAEIRKTLDGSPQLVDAWERVRPSEPGFTWDQDNTHVVGPEPSYRIDYVLTNTQSTVVDARLFGRGRPVPPSDHYGVAVDLKRGQAPSPARR